MVHSAELLARIASFREDEARIVGLGMRLTSEGGAALFPLDLLAFAALKRSSSTTSAIGLLVEAENLLAARAMLRIHLDTALRFAAAWFVHKPHDFATAVNRGDRIDKIRDRDGQQLRDARLIELLAPLHPWLPTVYANLSGYIHFSGQHIAGSITGLNKEARQFSVEIGATDVHYPESSWIEVLDCAHRGTDILAHYLDGWIRTKAMSPEELADQ